MNATALVATANTVTDVAGEQTADPFTVALGSPWENPAHELTPAFVISRFLTGASCDLTGAPLSSIAATDKFTLLLDIHADVVGVWKHRSSAGLADRVFVNFKHDHGGELYAAAKTTDCKIGGIGPTSGMQTRRHNQVRVPVVPAFFSFSPDARAAYIAAGLGTQDELLRIALALLPALTERTLLYFDTPARGLTYREFYLANGRDTPDGTDQRLATLQERGLVKLTLTETADSLNGLGITVNAVEKAHSFWGLTDDGEKLIALIRERERPTEPDVPPIKFHRVGPGDYLSDDERFTLQSDHAMTAGGARRDWLLHDNEAPADEYAVYGMFDTKAEAVSYAHDILQGLVNSIHTV